MLDRKASIERPRKHSEIMKKRISCKFSRLLRVSDINLPLKLQKFVSKDRQLSDEDFAKNNASKIRVILKINESKDTPSCLTFNKNQNCVGLIDPTPSRRSHTSNSNDNLFPFDSIFTENDEQSSLLSNSIIDPIMEFFKGKDVCIFSFGNSGLGKTKTMIGSDQSISDVGIIPCALIWVFKAMEQLKINRRTRYAIRISAMEIANQNEVRDLLTNCSTTTSVTGAGDPNNLSSLLLDKPNTRQVSKQKELPAGSLQEAARILDTILAARSTDNDSLTHLQVVIHLHQYQFDSDKSQDCATKPIPDGRSRLHFLDLGSGRHGNEDSSILSLQGMSKVILALYTNQRHIPYKDNVLTRLLKDTIGVNTFTTMIVHISNKEQHYNDTLQIVQLASKLYRTRSRKSRSVGFPITEETSSCSSSSSGFQSRRPRPHMGIGATRRSGGNSSASSEMDMTSASEMSCGETVIFRGNANVSGSEKSWDQRSVKRNIKSGSSESDFVISDRESSQDYVSCSSSALSPSAIRRRKASPRTNARAWPSSTAGSNTASESERELWVDGPKAVYKSEIKQKSNSVNLKSVAMEPSIGPVSSSPTKKPVIMLKEPQCDDVCDSSSSLTDGSSHSNTLDRKDHRPLSDISECTEETESNIAIETDCAKMNTVNDICPIYDFEDLLDSTFALSPLHQELPPKLSVNEMNFTKHLIKDPLPRRKKPEKENSAKIIHETTTSDSRCRSPINLSNDVEVEKTMLAVKNAVEIRKHYHSASDSKRSSKSEQKERRSKSKCKKCSKKSSEQTSTSLSSSNSTDFSRVASWIQNVENSIQSPSTNNTPDDVFLDNAKSFEYSQHTHYQSQPDMSSHQRDRQHIIVPQYPLHPLQYHYPADNNWITSDFNHVQYSLYDRYQMQPGTPDSVIPQPELYRMQLHTGPPQISCVPHVCTHPNLIAAPPFQSPTMTRKHVPSLNISNGRHTVSTSQPPLPPLPQQAPCRDNRAVPIPYEPHRANPSPSPVLRHPKCKTLPRDMYSDPASPLKRNKSDVHPFKAAQYKGKSMTTMTDTKSREKVKKESIISILFAPFISLRKKINRAKSSLDKAANSIENDTDKSSQRQSDYNRSLEYPIKSEPEFILSSPYHLVTPPKISSLPIESSSHGSDSSSVQNRTSSKGRPYESSTKQHKSRTKSASNNSKNSTRQRPTSSGYGSIIVKGDSEVSSHNDSSSEYSISGPKVLSTHGRMKHSISLSNCRSVTDNNATNKINDPGVPVDGVHMVINEGARLKSITTAQDLILLEKLRVSLHDERRVVIEYIEINRLRGVPFEASVMNLICFKGVDNFEISNAQKRDECRSIIEQIDRETEQLKHRLNQAQNHLLLITTFDSNSQSRNSP